MLNDTMKVNLICTQPSYIIELDLYDIKDIMSDNKIFEKHMLMV